MKGELRDAAIAAYVRGPKAIEPARESRPRPWLTAALVIWESVEWTDPVLAFTVYSLPRELRPGQLLPIVRRMRWDYQRWRKDSGVEPESSYHRIEEPDLVRVDALVKGLGGAAKTLPRVSIDRLDPTWSPPANPRRALTVRSMRWTTGRIDIDFTWDLKASSRLDKAFGDLWMCLAEICATSVPRDDWQPTA